MRIFNLIFGMVLFLSFSGNSMDTSNCFNEIKYEFNVFNGEVNHGFDYPTPFRWGWLRVLAVASSDLAGAAGGLVIAAEAAAAITVGTAGAGAPAAAGVLVGGAIVGGVAASATAAGVTGRTQSTGNPGGIYNPIDISFSDEMLAQVGVQHNILLENSLNGTLESEEGRFINGLPENIRDVFNTDKWNFRKKEMLTKIYGINNENYKDKINQLSDSGILTQAVSNFFTDFLGSLYETKNPEEVKELLMTSMKKVGELNGIDKAAVEAGLSTFNHSLAYWSQKETNE